MPSLFTLVVLAAGAALRLWFIHVHPMVQGDSLLYGDIAANWLNHGIYGHSVGHESGITTVEPTLVRLPGYPAFLALILCPLRHRKLSCRGVHPGIHRPRHLPAHSAPGQETKRPTLPPAFALLLAALCPFTANYVAFPLTETLSILCVALGFLTFAELLERPRPLWTALLTFSWSYSALLRPDGALLAVVLWTALLVYGRNQMGLGKTLRIALITGLLSLLPFVPWTIRNCRTFHIFQPLAPRYANDPGEFASPGFVRWVKSFAADFTTTSEIYWNGNSDRIDLANLPSRAIDNPAQAEQTRALLQDYNAITTLTPALDDRFAQLAQERIRAHPVRYYLTLPLLRLADMWLSPRVETINAHLRWWQYSQHPAETWLAIAYGLLNLAYLSLAFLGALRWPRMAGAMVAFILVRSLLLATLEAPESRYTLECFPLAVVLAAGYLSTVVLPGNSLIWKTLAGRATL